MRKPCGVWRVDSPEICFAPGFALNHPANSGLTRAMALLERGAQRHPQVIILVDVSAWDDYRRWRNYCCCALAKIFSGRYQAGPHAGKGITLLKVCFREADMPLSAPHWAG